MAETKRASATAAQLCRPPRRAEDLLPPGVSDPLADSEGVGTRQARAVGGGGGRHGTRDLGAARWEGEDAILLGAQGAWACTLSQGSTIEVQ